MNANRKLIAVGVGAGIVVGMILTLVVTGRVPPRLEQHEASAASPSSAEQRPRPDPNVVTVDEEQMQRMKIETVQLQPFRVEKKAIGRIAFNDERTTSIFAPFQGRIVRLIAKPGDSIRPGSPLLVIDSPDLVQANADLIAASVAVKRAQNQLTQIERVAKRQAILYEAKAIAYKDFEQSESDLRNAQHDLKTAQGVLTAARDRLPATFGKSDAEIAKIEETHQVDRIAQILSPIGGTVTVRKVSPAQFVRTDNTDPMFSVADLSSMWLIANVAEVDIPLIKVGQEVEVHVMAYPSEVFRARIKYIGASVDPTVRRVTVRAEIDNQDGKLKPDMFASFRIITSAQTQTPGVRAGAIVREGDTVAVWVATGPNIFVRREVTVGLEQAGAVQILDGVRAGDRVVAEGGVLLSRIRSTEVR